MTSNGVVGPTIPSVNTVEIVNPSVSGTCYDDLAQTTPCADGTKVDVAVNAAVQGTVTLFAGDGTWMISNVPMSSGNVITAFIDNAGSDPNRAVAVTKWGGSSLEVTGLDMVRSYLSIGSDEDQNITNANLDQYDNGASLDDDIFFDVVAGALTVDKNVLVASGDSFSPGGGVTMAGGASAGDHWINDGGTVEFTTGVFTSSYPGAVNIDGENTWYDFTADVEGQSLVFDNTATQTITGLFTVAGTGANELEIYSDSAGNQWEINQQGEEDVRYANILDSGCAGGDGGCDGHQ